MADARDLCIQYNWTSCLKSLGLATVNVLFYKLTFKSRSSPKLVMPFIRTVVQSSLVSRHRLVKFVYFRTFVLIYDVTVQASMSSSVIIGLHRFLLAWTLAVVRHFWQPSSATATLPTTLIVKRRYVWGSKNSQNSRRSIFHCCWTASQEQPILMWFRTDRLWSSAGCRKHSCKGSQYIPFQMRLLTDLCHWLANTCIQYS